jgi:hypothetical protein
LKRRNSRLSNNSSPLGSDTFKQEQKPFDLNDHSPCFPQSKDYTDDLLEQNPQYKISKKELLQLDRFKQNKKMKTADYKITIPNSFE